ncbi:MAG: DHH family phosphoesterase [Chloroflexota bacterium]|jgi:phosphoesterase RecJ-like protein
MIDSPHLIQAIRAQINSANRILLTSHIRPDGDAIGSLLGFGLALRQSGKQVVMALSDPVPHNFLHLTGSADIVRSPKGEFDTFITVDSADLKRIGAVCDSRQPDIQVDHHITNTGYARLNLIDPEAVATAAILTELLPQMGLEISLPVAEALLTGIITDTIGFRTSNMNPQALHLAAALMEKGANLPELYYKGLVQRSFAAARYWGVGLTTLKKKGRIIWATLTQADRHTVGYNGNDDADLTNLLSSISESDIAVLFIEQKENHVKISWRAQPGWDVSKLAARFGGGGHPAAAGAEVAGSLEEVQSTVLAATEALLSSNSG